MFEYHARELSKMGWKSVLLDIPGHGKNMDKPLSKETALLYITQVIKEQQELFRKDTKPIVIGGSLGGYLTMELLGVIPDQIQAAIITMCGQNVGVGRGMMASFGLKMMGWATSQMSQKTLLKMMAGECRKNGHIPEELLKEIALRPGMFFNQGQAQI